MTLRQIIATAAMEAGLTVDQFLGPCQRRVIAEPRQRAMAAAYATGRYSLPQIGRAFGDRDHTTVLHAVQKAERLGWIKAPLSRPSQRKDDRNGS